MDKPFSQACENNKGPILKVLLSAFAPSRRVLEIGSGTGQHAVYFAAALPRLVWQPTDRAEYLAGIQQWLDDYLGHNMAPLRALDVMDTDWPSDFDAVFTANTLHIMPWSSAQHLIAEVGRRLPEFGMFAVYGPFNEGGEYTSPSNREFDQWLKSRAAHQGIRDREAVVSCAQHAGMALIRAHALPANNQLLVFHKAPASQPAHST